MTIYVGADHGGFELKEAVKNWLADWGYDVEDMGALAPEPDDDYPNYAFAVANAVTKAVTTSGEGSAWGVLLCRSGGGMTIAANKVPGIRAVAASSPREAVHARENNNANILTLSGDWLDETKAKETLKAFLDTPFNTASHHQRRLTMISQYERETMKRDTS